MLGDPALQVSVVEAADEEVPVVEVGMSFNIGELCMKE